MLLREDYEEWEEKFLAPYAVKAKKSKGRKYEEKESPFRSCYQRDRDRIIHSTAFRRLEYKTQVFVNHEGDYYRTRLTHTIEVNQIAKTIARALRLNEDLVDAISLAHDIGHTPFGHAGEEELNRLMKDYGGFEHNLQGLRVVDKLEKRYQEFDGLNLTFETREGIIRHNTLYDNPPKVKEFSKIESPTLESQVINVADIIAYNSHDLDDGIKSGYLQIEELMEIKIWKEIYIKVKKKLKDSPKHLWIYTTIRRIIDEQVKDIVNYTDSRIKKFKVNSVERVRELEGIVNFSPAEEEKQVELSKFLKTKLYNHYRVLKMCDKSKRYVNALFNIYLKDIRLLPPDFRDKDNPYQGVCDYIAGMTDRFLQDEYERFFIPYTKM
jgi:dGTPase